MWLHHKIGEKREKKKEKKNPDLDMGVK